MMASVPDLALGAKRRHRRLLIVVFGATLATDMLSKIAISQSIHDSPLAIVGDVQLRILYNSQAPFGLGGSDLGRAVLFAAAIAVMVLVIWAWRGGTRLVVPIGLTTGGATANLLDRLLGGGVLDWIDGGFGGVFNLADVAIVIGLALFLSANFGESPAEEHRDTPNGDTPGG